jgi:hypothetical protein
MSEDILFIPCYIRQVVGEADLSLRLKVETQELNDRDMAAVMKMYRGRYGIMAFKPEEFSSEEKKVFKDIKLELSDPKLKSPSKVLRDHLFVLFQKNNEGYKDFDSYYRFAMGKIINMVKEKIDKHSI